MKIGILGGSFDPIHKGHLHIAMCAGEEYGLDQVWLIPAGHSPNKDEEKMTPGEIRLQMTAKAIGADLFFDQAGEKKRLSPARGTRYPGLWVSAAEVDSPEISYTYKTLEKLCGRYPKHQFFFIMGADSLDYFDHWVKPERICRMATILVFKRKSLTDEKIRQKAARIRKLFPADIRIIHGKAMDISSRQIRSRLLQGLPVEEALTPEVFSFIRENGLYEDRR